MFVHLAVKKLKVYVSDLLAVVYFEFMGHMICKHLLSLSLSPYLYIFQLDLPRIQFKTLTCTYVYKSVHIYVLNSEALAMHMQAMKFF